MPSATTALELSRMYNETLARDGSILPHWQRVITALEGLTPAEIEHRQLDISRQLRAYGIAYSALYNPVHSSRPWKLDLAPLVIEPADWNPISRALEQRALLKQEILRDIYGGQKLLKQRLIPPEMVFAHKGYLRDAVNLQCEQELPMFTGDISRAPSGQWYIVDDICQYPEGMGYSIENRLVLSSTLSRLFRQCRVQRIASHFKQLQLSIAELSPGDERCVLLAYGPEHPHYFEYAFLAKYLGYTLVQSADLTVRDNLVYL